MQFIENKETLILPSSDKISSFLIVDNVHTDGGDAGRLEHRYRGSTEAELCQDDAEGVAKPSERDRRVEGAHERRERGHADRET